MKNKVLIVDDDRDVCRVLHRDLIKEGYNASFVLNGTDGINKIKECNYNLAILDLKLPDVYGIEVLKKIRAFNKYIQVIIFTAYPSMETAVEALRYNVSDYLLKPYDPGYFINTVKKVLDENVLIKNGIVELEKIGNKIKQIRLMKDLSINELARRTKLSKSFLSMLERNEKFARIDTLQKICKELRVTLLFLFKNSEDGFKMK